MKKQKTVPKSSEMELATAISQARSWEDLKVLAERMKKLKTPVPVPAFIRIDMVFDGEKTRGWVHTHGMNDIFGLPDLEVVAVSPLYLMPEAGRMLNHVAQYMVDAWMGVNDAKPISLGQTMGLSRHCLLRFVESKPLNPEDADEIDGHYKNPRWRVVDVLEAFKCAVDGKGIEGTEGSA
jgi:hypothetical protein